MTRVSWIKGLALLLFVGTCVTGRAEEYDVLIRKGRVLDGTGLAAEVCHIEDRGFIRPGAYADLLVFDPLKVKDKATFDKPRQQSEGMLWVLVNGRIAIENGKATHVRAGIVLRHKP